MWLEWLCWFNLSTSKYIIGFENGKHKIQLRWPTLRLCSTYVPRKPTSLIHFYRAVVSFFCIDVALYQSKFNVLLLQKRKEPKPRAIPASYPWRPHQFLWSPFRVLFQWLCFSSLHKLKFASCIIIICFITGWSGSICAYLD